MSNCNIKTLLISEKQIHSKGYALNHEKLFSQKCLPSILKITHTHFNKGQLLFCPTKKSGKVCILRES